MLKYLLLALVLSGCGSITSEEWAEAEKICKANEGVSSIKIDLSIVKIYCRNGVTYEIK